MDCLGTEVVFHNDDIRLGFHIGKEPTLFQSFENVVVNTPLKAMQIYIADEGKPWEAPPQQPQDILMTRALLRRWDKYACIHGSLMYNLAGCVGGKQDNKFSRSLNNTVCGLIGELDVAAGFGAGVVVHIGAAKNKKEGIFTICRAVEACLERETTYTRTLSRDLQVPVLINRKIILENAAGEGNKIGSNLDEIVQIYDGIHERFRPQVKVCIDTAHIFGAGQYDFGSSKDVVKFFKEFDQKIGLDNLELFHLNDSRVAYGSKKDRHENLGMGYIFGIDRDERSVEDGGDGDGLEGLKTLIDFAEQRRIPLIGEPPHSDRNGELSAGPGWDYQVIKHLCNLEECHFLC